MRHPEKRWRRARRAERNEQFQSEQERTIRRGLESLREDTARDVMTPRVDVVALRLPVRYEDVATAVRRSGHSHFPVYEDDLDRLTGVLFVKDLFHLGAPSLGIPPDLDVTRRLREPFLVPESRPALELLATMRTNRRGFAVVVDEYGGVAGVATIKDLVSELVGDLRDEFDRSVTPSIHRVDRSRLLVDGSCSVDDLRETVAIPIPEGEYVTLGGYLFDAFGHIPVDGESIRCDGWTLRIEEMDRRRIAKVIIQAPEALEASGSLSSGPALRRTNRSDGSTRSGEKTAESSTPLPIADTDKAD